MRRYQNKYMLRTLASKIPNSEVTCKKRYLYTAIFDIRTFNKVRLEILNVFSMKASTCGGAILRR